MLSCFCVQTAAAFSVLHKHLGLMLPLAADIFCKAANQVKAAKGSPQKIEIIKGKSLVE